MEIWQKLGLRDKEKRRLWQLGALLLAGLLLMAFSGGLATSDKPAAKAQEAAVTNAAPPASAEEALEQRLAAVLSRIEGAGEVSVSLTFARSAQTEYASNASTTVRTTEEFVAPMSRLPAILGCWPTAMAGRLSCSKLWRRCKAFWW